MPVTFDGKLVVAISSRALFNLEQSHRIYESEGLAAYHAYQIAHEEEVLEPGDAFTVISDHEPRPLQYQIEAKFPDLFGWTYVEQGPQVWRAIISREAASCCGCCGGA